MKIFHIEWYTDSRYFEEYFLHFKAAAERFNDLTDVDCDPIIKTIYVSEYKCEYNLDKSV